MSLADVYERVRPACVAITLIREKETGFDQLTFGSGVCIHPSGVIVTAKHVVTQYYKALKGEDVAQGPGSQPDFRVLFCGHGGHIARGARPYAILTSEEYDLAYLKIVPPESEPWPFVTLPAEFAVRPGDAIGAAGFPMRVLNESLEPNLFAGVVSRIDWSPMEEGKLDGPWRLHRLIEDVSVHPGTSGGPVFDAETGHLLGVVSAQRLRDLDAEQIRGEVRETAAGSDPSRYRVWTNLTDVVPWMAIDPQAVEVLSKAAPDSSFPEGPIGSQRTVPVR